MTYTNENGVIFTGKTVSAVEVWPWSTRPDQYRYFLLPTDTPWFSVPEDRLTLEDQHSQPHRDIKP